MVVTHIAQPEIHANRAINLAISAGEIPGWDSMITVKDAHALIVKGIESDRKQSFAHPAEPPNDPWEIPSSDEDLIYNSVPLGDLVIGKTYLFVFKERARQSDNWLDYAKCAYMVSASKFDGASAYMVASVIDHSRDNGWVVVANNTTDLFAADGWRAFERI